ncbi:peptidyl-prolyl cis-trans isomerase [Candidatus Woesearchaeota archaeon]|nr:peptidyl-prolyl cis-trans isomerase [Candidatus Woesearchaeota archaeon]
MEGQENNGEHKIRRRGAGRIGLKIFLSVAVIAILALAIFLLSDLFLEKNGFEKSVESYYQTYPDGVMTLQRFSGPAAVPVAAQVASHCEGFAMEDFYVAEIVSQKQHKSLVYVLDPSSREIVCVIEQDFSLGTSNAGVATNLLASVNGEPVYTDEVLAIFNSIPANLQTNQSLNDAFNQAINNKLLLQEARRVGLEVSSEEIDASVNAFLSQNGLTAESFEAALLQANSSIQKFRGQVKNDLLIQKMILEIAKTAEGVSEDEISTFYEAYKDNLTTIPRSATSQLMIYANQSTATAKLEYAKGIASQINATNFCELVSLYSEDLASKNNCGLYDAQMGSLLPEYEEIVYSSKPGDIKLISTRLGYHIVQVLQIEPARPLSYEEAHDDISDLIALQKRQGALAGYLQSLRGSAEIVNYVAGQGQ